MLIRSLASTFPKRFVMFRSSSIQLLLLHRVRNFDLAVDDALFRRFDDFDDGRRDQIFVVVVQCVADALVLKAIDMDDRRSADCATRSLTIW